MSDRSIVVTTRVAVDPADAFAVFTEEIGLWWRRQPRYQFQPGRAGVMRCEPGVGGRLLEEYAPGDAHEVGRVRVWSPPGRLVLTWFGRGRPDEGETEVEVRFEPEQGGTRVTVEHRGWERLPPGHPARLGVSGPALHGVIGQWWADQLGALASRRAGPPAP